jgi:hypothetical protein
VKAIEQATIALAEKKEAREAAKQLREDEEKVSTDASMESVAARERTSESWEGRCGPETCEPARNIAAVLGSETER